jgi:16S rRNA (adenine1518-N6/adenine1519-N6)-dimethyltransferase
MTTAKKRFGQNFLADPHKADNLVAALHISTGESVIEVGPGTGILTERILSKGANLFAIELDRDLIAPLEERFGNNINFHLIENDIIKVNPRNLGSGKFKIIGNLPYNISGAMMEWLIEYYDIISQAVITVQKEVASRIRAVPENRDYGSLSVIIQSYYDIKRLFDIQPGSFSPTPKVVSTALSLEPNKKIPEEINFGTFKEFLRSCFAQKRKKLTNSLLAQSPVGNKAMKRERLENYLARLGKKADIRAEQLNLKDFLELYKLARE